MDIIERADELHKKGFNCAQGVLCALSEYTGLDEKTALALSGGFGGGVRCGEICGAISGAVMALGLCYPYNDCTESAAKVRIAELTKGLTRQFKEEFGCVRCIELKQKGIDCGELIKYAAGLAEKIIKDNQ